eukprot:scaffold11768_cov19-Tisochrysis_lutea.AAC.1
MSTAAESPPSTSPAAPAGGSDADSSSASSPAPAHVAENAQAYPVPDAGDVAVLGCLTAGGQLLRCKEALVAGPRVLRDGMQGSILVSLKMSVYYMRLQLLMGSNAYAV